MAITIFPLTQETLRAEYWSQLATALDHGSNSDELVNATDKTLDDTNVIYRYSTTIGTLSSETLTSIPTLDFSIEARSVWHFEYLLDVDRVGSTNLDVGLVIPEGVQIYSLAIMPDESGLAALNTVRLDGTNTTAEVNIFVDASSGNEFELPLRIVGIAIATGAGGAIEFQAAKGNASSSYCIINTASTLIARRMPS